MPYGLYAGMAAHGILIALTLICPGRPRWLANVAFVVAAAYNEAPFLILILVLASMTPALLSATTTLEAVIDGGVIILLAAGLAVIVWRSAHARPAIARALDAALGRRWRDRIDPALAAGLRTRPPWGWVLFFPLVLPRPGIRRVRNIAYGPAGRANRLDLYRARSGVTDAPVLVYFHGGSYSSGHKSMQSRALLYRFARRGWVTISANYRLRPHAGFVDHLTDAKRVIAWIRAEGTRYGIDARRIVLCGGSAGGHLATMSGLTQNDPAFQEGFEDVDTSVWAVASFYGWYDGYFGLGGVASPAGPVGRDATDAPPLFIAHGAKDTIALVEFARMTAAHVRAESHAPVVYAELPYGQHSFDVFHSIRFSAVVDGLEAFTALLRSQAPMRSGAHGPT